eukprot:scaffold336_cov34-Prasinocladus_malaysianus.AAC.1
MVLPVAGLTLGLTSVVAQLRAGLALDLPEATAAVRAARMTGSDSVITAALPRPPQLPTFATKSDTDAEIKRDARAQVISNAQQQCLALVRRMRALLLGADRLADSAFSLWDI